MKQARSRVVAAMAAGLFAAAALGSATASAERVWDLDQYDKCMDDLYWNGTPKTQQERDAIRQFCCQLSGGELSSPSPTEGNRQCVAPAPESNPKGPAAPPTPVRPPTVILPPAPVATA
jgi:hypothetical protein